MPSNDLKPAIRAALRMNEIGTASPYQLSFAGKARSGGSFGFMQGDLAANQGVVTNTFKAALKAEGFSAARIQSILKLVSVHTVKNPLSSSDFSDVNAALQAQSALIDAMDEQILQGVYGDLDKCSATAKGAGRNIDPKALLYIALWVNMSGPPSRLLLWLAGKEPGLPRPVPSAGATVTATQMETYLRATSYFVANPGNFPHLANSVAAGASLLPGADALALPVAALAQPVLYATQQPIGDHLVYEQKTGHLLTCEGGQYDLLAVGYSGSLSRHGKNDPDQQCVKMTGPIPRGRYTIGPPGPGPSPYSLRLTPDPSNDMCGRGDFLIHGDSLRHPGDASDGCIILTSAERHALVATGLKTLIVVAQVSA